MEMMAAGAWQRWLGIGVIMVAFLALATTYSLVTPPFEASDEIWHYPYVKHIADGKGLPIQRPNPDENVARQEGSQPPLYYLLGALATFWIETGEARDLVWINPHAQVGVPLAQGNKNMVIHTQAEAFPYRAQYLALHLVRLLSVLMGAGTVLLTYLIALELFPGERALAAGAAAINAFIPQFLFIAGSVSNDNLVTLLSSLTLLLMLRLLRSGLSLAGVGLLGLVLGLALLSKLSALGLLPLALLLLGGASLQKGSWRDFAWSASLLLLVSAAVAGWWYLRNWFLYGDPLGIEMMLRIVGRRELSLLQWLPELEGLRISFWALFGAFNVLADPLLYNLFDALSLLGAAGLLLFLLRGQHTWAGKKLPLAILALWPVILFASLVRWALLTLGSTGRLLFPALSPISLLLFLGLASLVPKRYVGPLAASLGGLLFLVAAIAPFRYIAPAYARPLFLTSAEITSIPNPIRLNFGDKMELIGYDAQARARPGEQLRLTLYWRSLAKMDRDYSIFLHLFGRDERPLGQLDTYPGRGSYPTRLWFPGEILRDDLTIPIAADAAAPLLARVELGLYELESMRRLPIRGGTGALPGDKAFLTDVKILPTGAKEPSIENPRLVPLDDISLLGYDLRREDPAGPLRPGQVLRLALYWRAEGTPRADYTVFAHLVDEEGRIWAQHDGEPRGGNYPTSAWEAGEAVRDDHTLVLNPQAPDGTYTLQVGMYRWSTGQRLHLPGGSDTIPLEQLKVWKP